MKSDFVLVLCQCLSQHSEISDLLWLNIHSRYILSWDFGSPVIEKLSLQFLGWFINSTMYLVIVELSLNGSTSRILWENHCLLLTIFISYYLKIFNDFTYFFCLWNSQINFVFILLYLSSGCLLTGVGAEDLSLSILLISRQVLRRGKKI